MGPHTTRFPPVEPKANTMKRITTILLSILAMLTVSGCSEDDADKVILLVDCSDYEPESGQTIYFDINTFTTDGARITNVDIESFDSENSSRFLVSIPADTEEFQYRYEYVVPAFHSNNMGVELTFTSHSSSDGIQTVTRKINVSAERVLAELTGIDIHSPASGLPDGFSLTTMQPLLTGTSDESEIDIYIPAGQDQNELARIFRTMTDVRFSRANNFNYASATAGSVSDAYTSSTVYNYVGNLETGDIILVGRGSEAVGVIKVAGIYDNAGSDEDRISFNIKVVE